MPKIDKSFTLPYPEDGDEDFMWVPIARLGSVVPFGYEQDPDDPLIINPIVRELELLELAKQHVKQYSYRDVANWLSTQSERYISHVGLRARIKNETKRKRQVANYEQLARRYKEAADKAQEIREKSLGYRRERVE